MKNLYYEKGFLYFSRVSKKYQSKIMKQASEEVEESLENAYFLFNNLNQSKYLFLEWRNY